MIMPKTIDSSILSLIVLIFIYINAYNRSEKILIDYKLFITLVLTNMLLLVIDILSWTFNGLPGQINLICNSVFNLSLFITEPAVAILWILYINYQVFHNQNKIKKLKNIFILVFTFNAALSFISLYTGWFFIIDGNNIYRRGNNYWIHIIICYGLLVFSVFYIFKNRKIIEKRYYKSMLLFIFPPMLGITVQVFFYGVSLTWTGMMVSLLIIYFNIQDHGLNTDYLTGVYNRRQLDSYIEDKIQNSTEKKSFSAILIDINEFKKINDRFGHDTGDKALKDSVNIIRKSLHQDDFIARYGGDEFFIILDTNSREILEQTTEKIKHNAEKFNIENRDPYELSFSMGYDVYNFKSSQKSDDFFKHIDKLMYNNKKSLTAPLIQN